MHSLKKVITLIFILIFAATIAIPTFAGEATFRAAKIDTFTGKVTVTKSGGEKSFNAFEGMNLTEGDSLRTGYNASAVLYIDDDKEVIIGENTKIDISQLGGSIEGENDKTGVKLWFGKAYINIKKKLNIRSKFEVKTPTVVAGARGTKFYVEQTEDRTGIAVLEGAITATVFIPEELQETKEINTVIHANEQAVVEPQVLAQQSSPQIKLDKIQPEDLDLIVLEAVKKEPEGIDQSILQRIDQVIEQKREEKAKEEEMRLEEQEKAATAPVPAIIYDEEVREVPKPIQELAHESSPIPVSLVAIEIDTLASKNTYTVGESLGITVNGRYSDGSTQVLSITADNISGFDSSVPIASQILTVTVEGKTVTYSVVINAVIDQTYSYYGIEGLVGETITLKGAYGFELSTSVSVGADVYPGTFNSTDNTITFVFPASLAAGKYPLSVSGKDGRQVILNNGLVIVLSKGLTGAAIDGLGGQGTVNITVALSPYNSLSSEDHCFLVAATNTNDAIVMASGHKSTEEDSAFIYFADLIANGSYIGEIATSLTGSPINLYAVWKSDNGRVDGAVLLATNINLNE